ncbi:phage head morphogenesis protein, partial [Salmonella enterica subsp. enterica serovar Dublin]|nr:phage head morphogenesis protein [Salmonella enterica subsp. enterica serovar Dublin]
GWYEKLLADARELSDYEINWNVKTLSTNVNANFVTPAAEQVWAAATFAPLELSEKPVDFVSLMSGWRQTEVNRLVMGVKSGFVQGMTTRQIVKNVVGAGGLADISERNAATVIRTALAHVSNEARQQVYAQNDDIITKYEWVSTLDSRTSAVCRARDSMQYEIGKGPLPP